MFLQGQLDSSRILFKRNGIKQKKVIHRYKHPAFLKTFWPPSYIVNWKWKIIDDSILYINVTKVGKKELKRLLKKLNSFKALILDMRYYSIEKGVGIISRAIHKKRVKFAKFLVPCKHDPGKFYFRNSIFDKTGRTNNHYFKGKVVLLFNETTQSAGEFSGMTLQSAPNVTSIGSQTAGADGTVVPVILPGGYKTWFSARGVYYYPSGKNTQRKGLHIDIVVHPTIQGIRAGKDEVFERAVHFIKEMK